jgi:thiamine-monophosphate kinase
MHIQSINEDTFIQNLLHNFPVKEPLVGIGDDCAVIPDGQGGGWLVTTDALVEGVHFLKNQISALDLGYKTISVNVSDIAAMGGTPKYAFLSIAFPKTIEKTWISNLIGGIKEACSKWNILLLGGDTVGSKRDIFLNLTLIGSAPLSHIKYRNQAQIGDAICVTGSLGNSWAGFKVLQNQIPVDTSVSQLLQAHFHPEPHLAQGIWLGSQKDVHAMMDISDGLDRDLKRLLKSSRCGAIVETSKIPQGPALLEVCQHNQWDSLTLALNGGEDYCLLLTVSSSHLAALQQAFHQQFNTYLYEIGSITAETEKLIYQECGKDFQFKEENFDHFQ